MLPVNVPFQSVAIVYSALRIEYLMLLFSLPRDMLSIEIPLRNLDFGLFPYELMKSSVAFLVFVTSLLKAKSE